ncbi:MAG: M20/M25/M40 family metallo-hydrolase [Myxococcota bacterium]
MSLDRAAALAFADTSRAAWVADLKTLVEIPSISADPARAADVRRTADAAITILRRLGASAELRETPGAPLVVGLFAANPSAPTVTVYNHLDVQPANEPEWRSEPFRLTVERGEVYRGRGTTDDKGPALTAAYAAKLAKEQRLPINIRFLWELEEEIGSPNFEAGLMRHQDALRTDSVVVSDTVWITRGLPSTPSGLRGMQSFTLSLRTAEHDLHSGLVGGAVRNPHAELIALCAEMFDGRTGEVKIPGFYDDVEPIERQEIEGFLRCGFTVEQFLADHHHPKLRVRDPLEVMTRVWAMPTMEVHGFAGGYTGPGVKSAVPAAAELKMSCRMVPGMRGARLMERIQAFVAERAPEVVVKSEGRLEAYRGPITGPRAEAIKDAYDFGFGKPAAIVREGVSIGAVPTMEAVLGAPVHFLGLSLPEHGYHAPNEFFDWQQARGGMAAFYRYFQALSAL